MSTTKDPGAVDALVRQWCAVDPNPQSVAEMRQLLADGRHDVLSRKLATRIAFGTAGLRAAMESGFAYMNDVTVLQASQGLVSFLKQQGGTSLVVGHDHRFNSQRFAEITAGVAIVAGLTVYYLDQVHTPLVPFAIDHYHASGGVMVTASHNPANDNGYKVYYANGCQIIPPIDAQIAASIDANLVPWPRVWDTAASLAPAAPPAAAGAAPHAAPGAVVRAKQEITALYVQKVKQMAVKPAPRFVYTPMHGVGDEIFSQIFHNYEIVPQQAVPDPAFPTVKFPNPEEKGALDLAMKHADALGLKMVLANDPDADRFSVAVKTDRWRQLTGNEIGLLFACHVIENTSDKANTYLLNSTVLSQIFKSMAQHEGFHYQDTLTGFKWIGNKAIELRSQGYNVPFAYEEAIGFMFDTVSDKDGIAAAAVWTQFDFDPLQKLEEAYRKYGYYKECNGYYISRQVKETFDAVRSTYDQQPARIGDFEVVYWRDLTVGYESATLDGKSVLPLDPSSQMITGVLRRRGEPGEAEKALKPGEEVRFTCRGSGTEPKLKVYVEGRGATEAAAQQLASDCWAALGRWMGLE